MNKKLILFFILFLSAAPCLLAQEGVTEAMALIGDGKNDEAITLLNSELERNPSSSKVYVALGIAYLEKGDYALSKANLEKSLSLNSSSIPAQFTLAMLYEKEKNYTQAAAEWKNVLKLSPDKNLKILATKHIKQLEGNK